jgi:uncharacterized membrane protein (UPF0127 family)
VERVHRLPIWDDLPVGICVRDARSFRARLLGLAFLDGLDGGEALLVRGCRSIHTFGMRFAIDVVFVDGEMRVLKIARDVRPRRVVSCRRAAAAIEMGAGEADRLCAGLSLMRARAA